MTTLTKVQIRLTKVMIMALRCEYIEGLKLTKKGRGILTVKQWRIYNNIKCFFSHRWRDDLVKFLKLVDEQHKVTLN